VIEKGDAAAKARSTDDQMDQGENQASRKSDLRDTQSFLQSVDRWAKFSRVPV